jgi:hypothetical protein
MPATTDAPGLLAEKNKLLDEQKTRKAAATPGNRRPHNRTSVRRRRDPTTVADLVVIVGPAGVPRGIKQDREARQVAA